ncbi:hypothetical protein [Portibacter marinus]|uniref:hypothetical protein n=1 Tax=Portibacter marinus TaxID=2898660 RepID=UPI001F220E58|nr:hypothetical protein [Portibacter marinus]
MVTVSFLKFSGRNKWFAMTQMGRAHRWLSEVTGCDFYKLMGSGGGNGFSIIPDLSTYCLLMKWNSEQECDRFFDKSENWRAYRNRSDQNFTLYLKAVKVMGTWDAKQPFEMSEDLKGELVVLTRATIKKHYIPYFWSKVPKASADVRDTAGHVFSKGVGEVPLLHQATISVWKNKASMHAYAYQNDSHINMIRETREKGWYKEEMFAEFNLIKTKGKIWT